MIKVGIVASIYAPLSQETEKGTEIFVYQYLKELRQRTNLALTVFASGDSQVNYPLISSQSIASINDPDIGERHNSIFEAAHIGQALSYQDSVDLYHVHIQNGESVLPFLPFVHKPILITMHYLLTKPYRKKLFNLFQKAKNIFFVSISNSQRLPIPSLNYIKTIYHGVDPYLFQFDNQGGESILWTGRGVLEKGPEVVIQIAQKLKKETFLFAIKKDKQWEWFNNQVVKKTRLDNNIHLQLNVKRSNLIPHYQQAKLFLMPLNWEEPFGMTMIEAMSCGTPVIAFARGSVPEVVKDGKTGFIVNFSDNDIRGNWIIKKTGFAGLVEAVNKIYAMSPTEYQAMRRACRLHAEKNFTLKRMVNQYVAVYQEVIKRYQLSLGR